MTENEQSVIREIEPKFGRFAYVFPGQGSQELGMGKKEYDESSAARSIFSRVSKALGFSIEEVCFENEDRLNQTRFTQPALFTVSLAKVAALLEKRPEFHKKLPKFVAGHSAGEYPALVISGVLSLEEAALLSYERGEYMEQAGIKNPGGMAVIVGMTKNDVEALCRETLKGAQKDEVLDIAVENSSLQLVVSGTLNRLGILMDKARQEGAKRVEQLKISIASHSSLMEPARIALQHRLTNTHFQEPIIPLVMNGDIVKNASVIKDRLAGGLVTAVRWPPTVQALAQNGVHEVIEFGAKSTLVGFTKRVNPQLLLTKY